jgi:hypothetical protein
MNTDFVYYLSVDGAVLQHLIFSTEEEAEAYAIQQRFDDYFIIKWSVD